jgi:hypothetical protein
MHHGPGEGCGEKVVGKPGLEPADGIELIELRISQFDGKAATEGVSLFSAGVAGPPFRSNLLTE